MSLTDRAIIYIEPVQAFSWFWFSSTADYPVQPGHDQEAPELPTFSGAFFIRVSEGSNILVLLL